MAMTFLEKIKAKRAAENAKKAEAAKPEAAAPAAKEVSEAPKKEEKKPSPIHGLLARKKAMAAEKLANAAVEAAREQSQKPEEAAGEPLADEPLEEESEKDAPSDGILVDDAPKGEAEPAEDPQAKAAAEPTKEPEKANEEEKPKRRGGRRKATRGKKTEKTEPEVEVEETIDAAVAATINEDAPEMLNNSEFEVQDILGSKMSYEEMAAKVMSSLEDDEQQAWQGFKAEVIEELEKIKIAADMNPGTLKYTLMDLNELYGKIVVPHANAKALLEALTNKEDGVCVAIRMQASVGSNDYQRRGNGFSALANATYQGEKINFVNLIAATRVKYIFLESIKQRIRFMSDLCITMSSAIKLEERLDAQSA